MLDLKKQIDVFIITNGRSTFPYCKKSVDNQKNVMFKTSIIENKEWIKAHLDIVGSCQSKFFLRVDDDMFLNPYAISFFGECIKNQDDNIALRGCKLWEPWSNKMCRGIKIYNLDIVKKVGFRIDLLGKIDKPFAEDCEARGYNIKYSGDVVAIHACGKIEEHLKYWEMRGENKGIDFNKKREWATNLIKKCDLSLEQQYDLSGEFLLNLNKKNKTSFWDFINK